MLNHQSNQEKKKTKAAEKFLGFAHHTFSFFVLLEKVSHGSSSNIGRAVTATPTPKVSKPKPGDRVVYLMHDESGLKQAYQGNITGRSRCAVSKAFAPAGWFDIAFDDGDNLSVFMNLSNRGKVWDHALSNGDVGTVSAALEQVLCDDAAAAGAAAASGPLPTGN